MTCSTCIAAAFNMHISIALWSIRPDGLCLAFLYFDNIQIHPRLLCTGEDLCQGMMAICKSAAVRPAAEVCLH